MAVDRRTGGGPERSGDAGVGAARLVVGMTTLPTRIAEIRPSLQSLLDGERPPDAIVLSLPRVAMRGQGAWRLPDFLADPGWHDGRVHLQWIDGDCGPGTKLLGALPALDPADIVVLADDDVRYHPSFLAGIERAMRRSARPAAFSYYTYRFARLWIGQGCDGFAIRAVDVVEARRFFDRHVAGTNLIFHDDLWISYLLATQGIAVRSATLPPDVALIYDQVHEIDALRYLPGILERDRLSRAETARLRRVVPIPMRHRARLALGGAREAAARSLPGARLRRARPTGETVS